jgi:hypothetical protein
MRNSPEPRATAFSVRSGIRLRKPGRRSVVVLAALVLAIGSAPTALAARPAPEAAVAVPAAGVGGAGHDYATDVFADPWDYSNAEGRYWLCLTIAAAP